MTEKKTLDVIIVGAGLSGIGTAYHLKNKCPHLSFKILESRASLGGTWDLFKYPGIRSDSDMYTFGFGFHPWKDPKAIADGPSILQYIHETADTFDIRKHIEFDKKVLSASWNSETKKWTLEIQNKGVETPQWIDCHFLFTCTGYYNYEQGYAPSFPNADRFHGPIIHPQKWDPNVDYADKEVVIIGSGATAVTLLPELAKKAKKVTMLQRSPTYIMNLPQEDKIANFFKKALPAKMAHTLSRWKNILISIGFYQVSKRYPQKVKSFLKKQVQKQLGEKYREKDFDPTYNPWDQRLCLVPDNNLFNAIKKGNAFIETDTIQTFTETGITLQSGKHLPADIIISATGLNLLLFGGMKLLVDGELLDTSKMHAYKGVMMSGVPNMAFAVGYTNASWTLKCDLNGQFVVKLLNYMKQKEYTVCVPQFDFEKLQSEPLLDFDAGYVLRAQNMLPKQGSKAPWKVYQNYIKDLYALKYGDVKDSYLHYS